MWSECEALYLEREEERMCALGNPVSGAVGVWGAGFTATGHSESLCKWSMCLVCIASRQFHWRLVVIGLRLDFPFSLILFIIYRDRISRCSPRAREGPVRDTFAECEAAQL